MLSRTKQSQLRKEEDINNTIQAHVDATEEMKASLQLQYDQEKENLLDKVKKQSIEYDFNYDVELLVQKASEEIYFS